MANSDSTSSENLIIDKQRSDIAIQASWELATLILEMRDIANKYLYLEKCTHDMYILKALSMRSHALNSVLMSVLGDDGDDNHNLIARIGGLELSKPVSDLN